MSKFGFGFISSGVVPYVGWDPSGSPMSVTTDAGTGANSDAGVPSGSQWRSAKAALGRSSGKWYWEILLQNSFASNAILGLMDSAASIAAGNYPGLVPKSVGMRDVGSFVNGWTINAAGAIGGTDVSGTVYMFAIDIDASKVWVGKGGTWFSSGNPAGGGSQWATINSSPVFPAAGLFQVGNLRLRTLSGQMSYSPPSGFTPWAGG